MKKLMILTLIICLLFAGCGRTEQQTDIATIPENQETVEQAEEAAPEPETTAPETSPVSEEQAEAATKIHPLPDTTMDDWQDAILSISLEEGNAYVDDAGQMQMDITIYSYDKYDFVDISMLEVGNILVTHTGEVKLESIVRNDDGSISINGGLASGGFDLTSGVGGCFYESGFNDAKNWYEVGQLTIPVSVDFVYHDTSDLEKGEILYYPGSFLIGEVTDYEFTPHNTTIRVENGQIIEMYRLYLP